MVFEIDEIISLYKLGYTKQAFSFLSKILNKRSNKPSYDIQQKLYGFCQELIKNKDYKHGIQLLTTLEDYSTKINDLSRLCDIKNSLSLCYRLNGQAIESLSKCLEALEVVSQLTELKHKLPALHLNACAIYREDLEDLKNAKIHAKLAFLSAKEHFNEHDSVKRTLAVSIYNLGFICDLAGDFKNAQFWYEEGLKFCEEHWREQSLLECIQFKHTCLLNKIKLLSRRVKVDAFQGRRVTSHGVRDSGYRRGCVNSQCSNRQRLKLEASTPVNLNSVSSHDKSTDHSVGGYESVFKIRKRKAKPIPDIFICDDL